MTRKKHRMIIIFMVVVSTATVLTYSWLSASVRTELCTGLFNDTIEEKEENYEECKESYPYHWIYIPTGLWFLSASALGLYFDSRYSNEHHTAKTATNK